MRDVTLCFSIVALGGCKCDGSWIFAEHVAKSRPSFARSPAQCDGLRSFRWRLLLSHVPIKPRKQHKHQDTKCQQCRAQHWPEDIVVDIEIDLAENARKLVAEGGGEEPAA